MAGNTFLVVLETGLKQVSNMETLDIPLYILFLDEPR
jgi:hypothetical protein